MSKAMVFWFTGLSGSGKTTIAERAAKILSRGDKRVKLLDGDVIRKKVTSHLSFTPKDIKENNKIIANLCLDNIANYDYVLIPVISPFYEARMLAKKIIGDNFYLVYVRASLDEIIKRDPKGLYKRALSGEIKNFIGIDKDTPYQPPRNADLVLDTEKEGPDESVGRLVHFIMKKNCFQEAHSE